VTDNPLCSYSQILSCFPDEARKLRLSGLSFDDLQQYFVKFSEKQRRLMIDTLQISVISVIRFTSFIDPVRWRVGPAHIETHCAAFGGGLIIR
jgi:hypothetical protein